VFGDLSLAAIPYGNPIIATTLEIAALMGLVVIALITYFRKWTYLWTEWLSSVDHKRIGPFRMADCRARWSCRASLRRQRPRSWFTFRTFCI